MIKRFIVFLFLFAGLLTMAQEGTSSPYSYYGLGDMRFRGTAENRAMSGLSIFSDSIHINLQNPAFYPHLKLTSFSLGASYMTTALKTNAQKETARRASLDYLAIAFPVGKNFGAGFGLMPHTSVGYKINTLPTPDFQQLREYNGNGGINKAFFGLGYRFSDHFSIGAEFQYYFGNIETTSTYRIADIQYGTQERNESAVSGVGFNTGLAFNTNVNKDLTLSAAATFATESDMKYSNERTIATVQFLGSGINEIDVETQPVDDTEITMPMRVSFGAGIGKIRKWMVGAEAEFRNSSVLSNRFEADSDADVIADVKFENSQKFVLGGYFTPNFTTFSGYYKRITYRAGLRYEKTGLIINGKSIEDAGFSLGFGLPLSGTFSNINLGFEYGKRGTRDAGLIEENYANFSVGLSFNDRWFVKRKYD